MGAGFFNGSITAEDRAIIVLSINFTLGTGSSDIIELREIGEEFFKKTPNILPRDLPLIYNMVKDFHISLVSAKERTGGEISAGVYGEVLENCQVLLKKLEEQCRRYGIDTVGTVS